MSAGLGCEDVRPLIPELSEGALRPAGPVEEHLAACAACSAELGRYRAVLLELAAFREILDEPAGDLLGRLLATVPELQRRRLLERVATDERVHRAVFSLGGAVVGATAVGLLWWRATHRGPLEQEPSAAGALLR